MSELPDYYAEAVEFLQDCIRYHELAEAVAIDRAIAAEPLAAYHREMRQQYNNVLLVVQGVRL